MQARSIFAPLAVVIAFASQSSDAGTGKVTTAAPLAGAQKASPTANAIRINPQPLPPLDNRANVKSARTGGDPPTVVDRR